MNNFNNKIDIFKYKLVVFSIFFIMFIYFFILFKMQVGNYLSYNRAANVLLSRTDKIDIPRGEILDRNKKVLVNNVSDFSLKISLQQYYDMSRELREEMLEYISAVLNISVDSIVNKLKSSGAYLKDIVIKERVDSQDLFKIAQRKKYYPAILWDISFKRNYIVPDSFSHIIGSVGKITQKEIRTLYNFEEYNNNSIVGKLGIENKYDRYIRGKEGYVSYLVDSRERIVSPYKIEKEAVVGNSLVLSIDERVQNLASSILADRYGVVIALNPANGEVLALHSYPYYSLSGVFDKDDINTYSFLNRAIQSSYSPASTFKLIMATAILQEKVFDKKRKVLCPGYYKVGNRYFRCWKHSGHGYVDLEDAIVNSCNVYFYHVALHYLGAENITKYAKEFGYGAKTEIDLPNEVAGLVPSPQWKRDVIGDIWVGGDTVNFSIGQGYLSVTPMQLANAISFIANEGVVYRPKIVKQILNKDRDEIILENKKEVLFKTEIIDREVFRELKRYMRGVITRGTAVGSVLTQSTKLIGKSGTSQTGVKDLDHDIFVSISSAEILDDNQVVVVALIEAQSNRGYWAPKIVDLMNEGIFNNRTYEELLRKYQVWYLR